MRFAIAQLHTERIAKAFAAAGIPARGLKGIALAEQLYPQAMLRDTGDIDILVAPDRQSDAVAALQGLGFERADSLDRLPGPLARFGAQLSKDVILRCAGATVELHRRAVFAPSLNRRLMSLCDELQPRPCDDGLSGPPIGPQLALYLILHGANSLWICMKWLLDLVPLLLRLDDAGRTTLIRFAERTHTTDVVRASLLLLDKVFPDAALGPLRDWCRNTQSQAVLSRLALYRGMLLAPAPQQSPLNNRKTALHSLLLLHDRPSDRIGVMPMAALSSGHRALGRLLARA